MAKHNFITMHEIHLWAISFAKGDRCMRVTKKALSELEPQHIPETEAPLYRVGRNASHYFYLGMKEDGTVVRASYGEEYRKEDPPEGWETWTSEQWWDWNDSRCEWVWHVTELGPDDELHYMGHY